MPRTCFPELPFAPGDVDLRSAMGNAIDVLGKVCIKYDLVGRIRLDTGEACMHIRSLLLWCELAKFWEQTSWSCIAWTRSLVKGQLSFPNGRALFITRRMWRKKSDMVLDQDMQFGDKMAEVIVIRRLCQEEGPVSWPYHHNAHFLPQTKSCAIRRAF